MDFETFLKTLSDGPIALELSIGHDGHVELQMNSRRFRIEGNHASVIPALADSAKPPAQILGVSGFNATKMMGDRA
jgi:hypothetical protein